MIGIVAMNRQGCIGKGNNLPWHYSADLKLFKKRTLNGTVIMGRNTWESLGRPLPGRENIVVTRTPGYDAPGAHVAASLDAALAFCAGETLAFVIGGGQLYAAALPIADAMVITEIGREYAGDARFPAYDRSAWRETQRKPQTAGDGLRFDFVLYEREFDSKTRTSGSGKPLKPLA